jgi:hypothetical protein
VVAGIDPPLMSSDETGGVLGPGREHWHRLQREASLPVLTSEKRLTFANYYIT